MKSVFCFNARFLLRQYTDIFKKYFANTTLYYQKKNRMSAGKMDLAITSVMYLLFVYSNWEKFSLYTKYQSRGWSVKSKVG